MKRTIESLFILLLFTTAFAQVHMKKIEISGDDIFIISELGMVLSGENNIVKIANLLPEETRPEAYREIELQEADTILMVNKKRVKSAYDVNKLYDSLDPGSDVKMGIQRDGQMLMIAFKKMDLEAQDGKRVMIIQDKMPDDDMSDDEQVVLKGAENLIILAGEGLVLEENNNTLTVFDVLPHAHTILGKTKIEPGSQLLSINDNPVNNKMDFDALYSKIKIGEKTTLLFKNKDKTVKVTFIKPEIKDNIIIKK